MNHQPKKKSGMVQTVKLCEQVCSSRCVFICIDIYMLSHIYFSIILYLYRGLVAFFVNWADETLIHGDEKHVVYVQSHRPFVVHSYITTLWSQEAQEWPHERADPLS